LLKPVREAYVSQFGDVVALNDLDIEVQERVPGAVKDSLVIHGGSRCQRGSA
jgi:cell wall assembly regulator SMI1